MRSNTLKSRKNIWKSLVAMLALSVIVMPAFAKPVNKIITIAAIRRSPAKQLKNDDLHFSS